MKYFSELFTEIDQTTKTNAKVTALVSYFEKADPEDVLWAIAILTGYTPRRGIRTAELKEWAAGQAGLPRWLFEESYYVVGDLAESIALFLPDPDQSGDYSLREIIRLLQKVAEAGNEEKKALITDQWRKHGTQERFLFNKLLTGNFRMGVSRQLVIRALALYLEKEEQLVAHRLMGSWDPGKETMESLFGEGTFHEKHYQPYPFYLAYQLDAEPESLGDLQEWLVEKKYDGIRGQLIVRKGELYIWSRGEELMTDKFPEFAALPARLPDGLVLDGEIIPWQDSRPLPFPVMQTRIGRKRITAKNLTEAPLVMICYDLLELEGEDIRHRPIRYRREQLAALLDRADTGGLLLLSAAMTFGSWDEVAVFRRDARRHHCEGVMLKKWDSIYETGRRRGNWWKWKTMPFTIDGVLLYAQSGHGRRANLFTDYTFAVWDGGQLVPFAKAYSGLTDKEIAELDAWVKRNTLEKFGPVRSVKPELVFEIAFEGIQRSTRHKSGVALRFPRILRWRRDKPAAEANSKADLEALIHAQQ